MATTGPQLIPDTPDKEVAMIAAALQLAFSVGLGSADTYDQMLDQYLQRFQKAYKAVKTAVDENQSPTAP